MLYPDYLRSAPDALVKLYAQVEADILANMAKRISRYDYYIPAAQWQRKKALELGLVESDILKRLGSTTGKSEKELKRLMEEAGVEALSVDDEVYKRAGLSPKPLVFSKPMQNIINAGLRQTNGTFKNLTKTTANTATKQFEDALDRAWFQVKTGAFDHNTAVRNAVKDLSKQGVQAIRYPSGKSDSIEVAVRRAVVTGLNKTCGELSEARAEEMGCDLVEVSAHGGARPDHAAWQGNIYSRSGKHPRYPSLAISTGYGTGAGLCGWNCRHSFSPYFEGSQRTYTDEMLRDYDAKKYEYNGQKMTEYEAQQQQRGIERNIRRWKRENLAMKAADKDTAKSASKIARWQEAEKDFIKQTGLKKQVGRSQIGGYGKSEAQAIVQANKKAIKDYAQQHISSVTSVPALNNISEDGIINNTAKRFANRNDADKLFRPWAEQAWLKLSQAEKDAAYQYTCASNPFNRPLRGYDKAWDNFVGVGKVPLNNEGAEKMISALRDGIAKIELQEDVWLFRGSAQQSLAGLLGIDKAKVVPSNVKALNRKFAGKPVNDNAFFSTGIAADAGLHDQISYEILAPKGTKGIYAEPFSFFGGTNTTADWDGIQKGSTVKSEAEMLLQADTWFEVNEINLINGKVNVVLKVIL